MGTKTGKRAQRTQGKNKTHPVKVQVPENQSANGNGSTSSTQGILQGLYLFMLKCRAGAEQGGQLEQVGHEAVIVGATAGLRNDDTVTASQPIGVQFAHGRKSGADPGDALQQDPVSLATGAALAHKLEKKGGVAVAITQAAALESWHEAFRFAGIHKLPVIYVLQRDATEDSIVERHSQVFDGISFVAREYGFPGIIVDGNDVVAVSRVVEESIHRARQGAGPTLIECQTQPVSSKDPLAYLEHYMRKRGLWNSTWKRQMAEELGLR